MDSEILTLQVDINDDPMNQKVDAIEERISTMQENVKQMTKDSSESTSILPGFNESFDGKLSEWQKDLDNILRARQSMDRALSSYERKGYAENYKRKVEVANASIKDLTNSKNLAHDLLNSLGTSMSETFSKGLESVVGQLAAGIRTTAQSISKGVTGKLTDEKIVSEYMRGDQFRGIQKKLATAYPEHAEAFSDQHMRQYLMATMPYNVPQFMRTAVTGGSHIEFRQQPRNFREMLPVSYGDIPVGRPTQLKALGSSKDGDMPLTREEIEKLSSLVHSERTAADAAVKAGIFTKHRGDMIYNHATTRDMVRSMGGYAFEDIVSAARGEKKFGIQDVESPRHFQRILGKRGHNQVLDGGLATAFALSELPWFRPGYFENSEGFDPTGPLAENMSEMYGKIAHKPRTINRAYAEYTLDMMDKGVRITGSNAVRQNAKGQWIQYSDIQGPSSAEANGYNIDFTPDDFHTMSMRSSMSKDMLEKASPVQTGHNGFSDSIIYLKYDKELSDPTLFSGSKQAQERKAEYERRIADRIRNGYTVTDENGNNIDYVFTRPGKTHAEFVRKDYLHRLGKYALGMEYDTPDNEETLAAGLELFKNDATDEQYADYKAFNKALYNRNLIATEGESLESLYGIPFGFSENEETAKRITDSTSQAERDKIMREYGTPNVKVVVGRFTKKRDDGSIVKLMDGANWASADFTNDSFQGRTFGGKATDVRIDMKEMRRLYPEQIRENELTRQKIAEAGPDVTDEQKKQIIQQFGDFVIPGAGFVEGEDLPVPYDTDIVESTDNIKNMSSWHGITTQAEANEKRSRDTSRFGIYAKTTYDAAATNSRWISKQLVNSAMNAGFRNPVVNAYFQKVFEDEVAKLDNDQYVRDLLFGGDQSVDLTAPESKQKIQNHLNGMLQRYAEGDRLLPTGMFSNAMAAPNPINVMNEMIRAAGGTVTEEQQALETKANEVLSLDSLAESLGILRFPATVGGNVTVDNKARSALEVAGKDKTMGQKVRRMARQLGLDPKGLYFAPDSPILEMLQGEDFDGDLNKLLAISGTPDDNFFDYTDPQTGETKRYRSSEVMSLLFKDSQAGHAKILRTAEQTMESQAKRKANPLFHKKHQNREGGYRTDSPEDIAHHIVEGQRTTSLMGTSDRSVDFLSLLGSRGLSKDIAQGILDNESMYDIVSTYNKTGEMWELTEEQKKLRGLGRSFTNIYKWANEAMETRGENDTSYQVWTGKSKKAFNDKNIDAVNLPSFGQGALAAQLLFGMRMSQKLGHSPEGLDINGSPLYDWDAIIGDLPDVDESTPVGRFTALTRGLKADILSHRIIAPSNERLAEMKESRDAARAQVERDAYAQHRFSAKRRKAQIEREWLNIGGQSFDNYLNAGLTQDRIMSDPVLRTAAQNTASAMGISIDELFSGVPQATEADISSGKPEVETTRSGKTASSSKTETAEGNSTSSQSIGTTEEKTEQKPRKPAKAEIIVTDKLPDTAQIPFQSADIKQEESEENETKRLLHQAINNKAREKILLDNKEALATALSTGSIDSLTSLTGISNKTAQKAVDALAGSKFAAGIITTALDKAQEAVESVQVPNLSNETPEADSVGGTNPVISNGQSQSPSGPRMIKCNVCGTVYPETLGQCPNTANHNQNTNQNITTPSSGSSGGPKGSGSSNNRSSNNPPSNPPSPPSNPPNPPNPPSNNPPNNPPNPPGNPPGGPPNPPNPPGNPPGNPPNPPNIPPSNRDLAKERYDEVVPNAQEFAKSLWGNNLLAEKRLNGIPESIIQLEKNEGIARSFAKKLTDIRNDQTQWDELSNDEKEDINRLLNPTTGLTSMAGLVFSNNAVLKSSNLIDDLKTANAKANGTYDPQIASLEQYEEKIKDVEKEQERLLTMSSDKKYSDKTRAKYGTDAVKLEENLKTLKAERERLKGYISDNANLRDQQRDYKIDQFSRSVKQMRREPFQDPQSFVGRIVRSRNATLDRLQGQKGQIDSMLFQERNKLAGMKQGDDKYAETAENVKKLEEASASADQAIKSMSGGMGTAGIAVSQFSQQISKLLAVFGKKMFHKALDETKKFIKEFDSAMTNIQMITLKSDTEMDTVGEGLINRAKELKISIGEIAQISTDLYRQGLTDEEMDDRLAVIAKFSKVSGTKAADATKLITTAMNTGLVTDATYAADVVAALGDAAATNAGQIEKGVEKAGAAAAVDGTTYAQLVAMLTAITATTQVSGNVAGTTLNSIFGRMNKVGTNELIYDENGNAMSGSDIAELLRAQGIAVEDENGKKRGSFDILYDLSKKYDTMSDTEQRQIATAIAGTRQFSNFSAIMTGMREGEIDRYMDVVGNSEGTVDKKFDVYTGSLQASMDNLKNSWDALVADLIDRGVITGFIDNLATMVDGFNNLTGSVGGLGGALSAVLPLFLMFQGAKIGGSIGGWVGTAAGAVIGGLGGFIMQNTLKDAGSQKTASERVQESQKRFEDAQEIKYSGIKRIKALSAKEVRTEEENKELATLINENAIKFGLGEGVDSEAFEAQYGIDALTSSLNNLTNASLDASKATDEVIKAADKQRQEDWARQINGDRSEYIDAAKELVDEEVKKSATKGGVGNAGISEELYEYDESKGKYVAKDISASDIREWIIGNDNAGYGGVVGADYGITGVANDPSGLIKSFKNAIAAQVFDDSTGAFKGLSGHRNATKAEVNNWSDETWTNYFAHEMSDEDLSAVMGYDLNYLNSSTKLDYTKTAAKNAFMSKYSDFGILSQYTDDQIDYLADIYANEYSANGGEAAFNKIFAGKDYAEMSKNINGLLENYRPKAQWLQQLGLEDAGTGGYYEVEEATGYNQGDKISALQANEIVDEYNTKLRNEQTVYTIIPHTEPGSEDAKEFGGIELKTFEYSEGTSATAKEMADAYAQEHSLYYWRDKNGVAHYNDDQGDYYTLEQRDEAAAEYKAQLEEEQKQEKIWTATRYEYDQLTGRKGKEIEYGGLTYEQAQEKANEKGLSLYSSDGKRINEKVYRSAFEAAEDMNAYRLQEIERYQTEYAEAIQEQQDNTTATYYNIKTGKTVTLAGSNAFKRAKAMNQKQIEDNPYVVFDKDHNYIGSATTEEDAYSLGRELTHEVVDQYGNSHGFGKAGLEALQAENEMMKENEENYEFFFNGISQGFGAKGKAKLESIRKYWTGKIDENTTGSKYVGPELYDAYDNAIDDFSVYPIELISEIATQLQEHVPDLKDVKPADIARIWGTLEGKVKDAAEIMVETGEVSLEVTDAVVKELGKSVDPKLKTIRNIFGSGLTTTQSAVKQNNQVSTSANAALNLLNTGNFNSIQDVFDYVNKNNLDWWSILNTNEDYAKALMGVKWGDKGNIISAPENALENMRTVLHKLGSNTTDRVLTNEQTADYAQHAFEALQDQVSPNGTGKYFASYDLAETAFNQANADFERDYEEKNGKMLSLDEWAEKYGVDKTDRNALYGYNQYSNDWKRRKNNEKGNLKDINTWLNANGYGYLTASEIEALRSTVGNNIANKMSSGGKLTDLENRFVETAISNKRVGLGKMATRQKLPEIESLRALAGSGGTISSEDAETYVNYLEGWSEAGDYLALLQAKGTAKFDELGGQEKLDTLNASLDQFIKNSKIEIEVEGIKTLEEAGEVAAGTFDIIQKLKKGGSFAIEAVITLREQTHKEGQLAAMLNSKDANKRMQAIMQIEDITDAQYRAKPEYWDERAASDMAVKRQQRANSLAFEYDNAPDEKKPDILQTMEDEGFEKEEEKHYRTYYDERAGRTVQELVPTKVKDVGVPELEDENIFYSAEKTYNATKIAQAQQRILTNKGYNSNDNLENAAAKSAGEELQRYLTMVEEDNKEGEHIDYTDEELEAQRAKAQAEVTASLLQSYEEEGTVFSGASEKFKNYAKGGNLATEALSELKNSAYKNNLYKAMLNGSRSEQIEAVKQLKGYDDAQIEAMGLDAAVLEGKNAANAISSQYDTFLETLYSSATTDEEKAAADKLAAELDYEQYNAPYESNVGRYIAKSGTVTRESGYLNAEKLRTDTELVDLQQQLLAGQLTEGSDEYKAATAKLGEQGQEYLRMLNQDGYDEAALNAQLAKAQAELNLARTEAVQSDALKEAKLYSGTAGGMFAYQQLQYKQNNKGALAANEIFRTLSAADVDSTEKLLSTLGDPNNAQNWKDLMEASPEFAKKLSDLGLSVDKSGNWSAALGSFAADAENAGTVLQILAEAAGAASESFKQEAPKTNAEMMKAATDYMNGNFYGAPGSAEETKQLQAVQEVFGSSEAKDLIGAARGEYEVERDVWNKGLAAARSELIPEGYTLGSDEKLHDTTAQGGGAVDENATALFNSKWEARRAQYLEENPEPTWKPFSAASSYNTPQLEAMWNNAQYGEVGLSAYDRAVELDRIMKAANSTERGANGEIINGIASLHGEDAMHMFDTIGSGIEGFDAWKKGVQILQDAGYALQEYSRDNQEANALLEQSGIAVQHFNELNERMAAEGLAANIEATHKFGKESTNVADIIRGLHGTEAERLATMQKMTKASTQLAKATYYTSGKGSKNWKKVAEEYLGKDKADIKALEKMYGKEGAKLKIQQEAELQFKVDQQQVTNNINAVLQDTIASLGDQFNVDDIEILIGGTFSVEQLESMAEEAKGVTKAIIDALLQVLAGYEGSVTFAGHEEGGDTIKVESTDLKTVGGGSGGGGGGGGGGKSEIDKMLEKHKYETAEAQHKIKMLQLDEEHYDYINDYGKWLNTIDKEVGANEELYGVYKKQLEELQGALAGLEEYGDEWYKVKDAIRSTEESMKEVLNTMNQLTAKRVDVILQKQEEEDKPISHKQRLWSAKAQKYQISGQFESYSVAENKRIAEYQENIDQNNKQIKELEKELTHQIEGSDGWIKARDQLWELTGQNAEWANEMEQARRDLQRATVEQIQTDLNNRMAPREHMTNMLSTYGNLYQNNRQYDEYRDTLRQTNAVLQEQRGLYEDSLAKMREEIKTLPEGSEAWTAARDAIYQYEEALAQNTLTQDENNRAIEQSRIDELTKRYEEASKQYSHSMNLLKTQQERFSKNNDYENEMQAVAAQTEIATERLEALKTEIESYRDLASQTTEDTEQWDTLIDKLYSAEEEYENLINEVEEFRRKMIQTEYDQITEKFNNQNNLDQHVLKMIQLQGQSYQTQGQLTNYGAMLKLENAQYEDINKKLEVYIEDLKRIIDETEAGTDDYYKYMEALYKAEEQYKGNTNAIEKNIEALKKNHEAILKVHKTLIDTIDNEVKARVKEQRDMLAAEVNIQNQILNVIRKRYQQECSIIKQDIANKKQALQEEKALINERLNARLQAEQDELKYNELTELQRQLTLIAADPTRTKDVKEIQKKIDDLEREIANQTAKEEAQSETERLDEESKALDEYVSYNEQKLNEMLKDANSTPLYEELNAVLNPEGRPAEEELMRQLNNYEVGSSEYNAIMEELESLKNDRFNNYMDWIRQNDETYKYGTEAMRLQMEQTNLDNWNKMIGFIDTYWDEVDRIINGGFDSVLNYMKESTTYRWSSEIGRELLDIGWGNQYEDMINAYRNDPLFDDYHELLERVSHELVDLNHSDDIEGIAKTLYDLYTAVLEYDYIRPTDVDPDADKIDYKDYKGVGKKEVKIGGKTYTTYVGYSNEGKSGSGSGKKTGEVIAYYIDNTGKKVYLKDEKGDTLRFSSPEEANKALEKKIKELKEADKKGYYNNNNVMSGYYTGGGNQNAYHYSSNNSNNKPSNGQSAWYNWGTPAASTISNSTRTAISNLLSSSSSTSSFASLANKDEKKYASGGLVDYTGPAWVDGTKTRPEAFLDPYDTENIKALTDVLNTVDVSAYQSYYPNAFDGFNQTIGDINITINQAEIKDGEDIERLANRVGEAFTRQLSRQGFQMSGYAF